MLHVGLTGGLATGKSTVGRMLAGLGCYLIQMDELGHQVMAPGGEAYAAILDRFGPDILLESGARPRPIDRRRLGARVFANPEELEVLSALLHPPIRARAAALAAAYAEQHPKGLIVTEAAILIETGSYREYDRLVVAACSREQQIERAMARDGLAREEILKRLDRQMAIEEKIKYADYVVDTSGTVQSVEEQTGALYVSLIALSRSSEAGRKETQS